MTGNAWEWTTDWYQEHGTIKHVCCTMANPRGGAPQQSFDPRTPDVRIPRKVMKGSSYLCAPNYCQRYRPAARMAQAIDTSTCHLGFRCITREPRKRLYRSRLRVCVTHGANLMSRVCKLLRMTPGTGCVSGASRHCWSRRARFSSMTQQARQSRVIRVVMFKFREIDTGSLYRSSNNNGEHN